LKESGFETEKGKNLERQKTSWKNRSFSVFLKEWGLRGFSRISFEKRLLRLIFFAGKFLKLSE